MPNDIHHERMRFNTMTPGKLFTRLNKITDPQKLRNFIQLAREFSYFSLEEAAIVRYNTLRGGGVEAIPPPPPPGVPYRARDLVVPLQTRDTRIVPDQAQAIGLNEKTSILLLDGLRVVKVKKKK